MIDSNARLDYDSCKATLLQRLEEKAPGRIQLLAGPRQVGKTHLVLELQEKLGDRALYLAADSPEAALPGAWERLWTRAEEIAASKSLAVVFLDEVHLLPNWSAALKGEWDRLRRKKIPIHVVATGSSALHLALGTRESLAGRFERLTLAHWSASALASGFKLTAADVASVVVERGAYPGAMDLRHDKARWTAYVRDAIVEPAIGRDILALGNVRKPALLRQVFGVAVSSPAQIVSLQKIQGQLQDNGALETVQHYLTLLEEAFLVAAVTKYEAKPSRQRASPPKLVALNNALLAATDPRGAPSPDSDPARFGAWVENACIAHAWNRGQTVSYWREEPYEVDAIVEGSWGKWAVEVKTGAFEPRELGGLLEFTRVHPTYRPIVLCDDGQSAWASRSGVNAVDWRRYLNEGLAAGL